MIGTSYTSKAIQAVLGPAHSQVIPDVLHGAWLDGSLNVLAMTGVTVPHSSFVAVTDGVANSATVDAGLCPSTEPTYFALMDAATSGDIIAYAAVTFASTPAEDDALSFEAGELVFVYTDGESSSS